MRELLVRQFDAELTEGDGRTIVGRCVPYDVEATVSDPDRPPYREVWRAGAFRHVLRAPHLVGLNFAHLTDLSNRVGAATELTEREDGLWGTFRALPTVFGDQGLELVRSGQVRGLSICARMHERGSRDGAGVVERIRVARLEHVALTDVPAFAGAEVVAVRDSAGDLTPAGTPALSAVLDWRTAAGARFARS